MLRRDNVGSWKWCVRLHMKGGKARDGNDRKTKCCYHCKWALNSVLVPNVLMNGIQSIEVNGENWKHQIKKWNETIRIKITKPSKRKIQRKKKINCHRYVCFIVIIYCYIHIENWITEAKVIFSPLQNEYTYKLYVYATHFFSFHTHTIFFSFWYDFFFLSAAILFLPLLLLSLLLLRIRCSKYNFVTN